mmetsp:Transcript_4177/g.4862  ORF Transcript_4177/g.4862 Transcript_4177/m.4862 type:complete len:328 (+) Transcript_4177:168-1151(+)
MLFFHSKSLLLVIAAAAVVVPVSSFSANTILTSSSSRPILATTTSRSSTSSLLLLQSSSTSTDNKVTNNSNNEVTSATQNDDEEDTTDNKSTIAVERPVIHWTVPGFKFGWQDDDGNWFDEDGPRDGLPLNYWRQRSDERYYKKDMDVVDIVINPTSTKEQIEEAIKETERARSQRNPSINRKLLGEWAPLLRSGKDVYTLSSDVIEVPWKIQLERTEGRKFAPKNNYGLFDAQLVEGETVTISYSGNNMDKTFLASKLNEPIIFGMVDDLPLFFGGLTYLSDYILIQRGPEGDIDLWLRCDTGYLGQNKEEDGTVVETTTTKKTKK